MARPRIDAEAVRARMVAETEALLRRHGPDKVTMSDVAAACGMSQSGAYRFFASRHALLVAVADRWFQDIEAGMAAILADPGLDPAGRITRLIRCQMDMKRQRLERDPGFFDACLDLAARDLSVVEGHLVRMRAMLARAVGEAMAAGVIAQDDPDRVAALIEVMTTRFRDPWSIRSHPAGCTPAALDEVMAVIFRGLAPQIAAM
ncbi:TetR/AcrR family transcriptional regulator [Tistrella mobilis]